MRKILSALIFFTAFFCQPAGADDALVLPGGAWRFYLVPNWTAFNATFNAEGKRQEIKAGAGSGRLFNLGYAVEFGLNKWLSAGFQWSPGTTLASALDYPAEDARHRDRAKLNDAFDAIVGCKVQLVGSPASGPKYATGLFRSAKLRLAFACGIKFPLTTIDWEQEAENFAQGKNYLVQAAEKHLVAPIASLHVDYVFVKDARQEFFINLYSQFIPYLVDGRYSQTSLASYSDPALADVKIAYGYDLLLEADPHFERWIVPRLLRLGFYLPVRCKIFPAVKLDGIGQGNDGFRWTLSPTLDLFTAKPKFPVELRVAYQYVFSGKNSAQASTWLVVLRVIIL
jgi:hypothetical protein